MLDFDLMISASSLLTAAIICAGVVMCVAFNVFLLIVDVLLLVRCHLEFRANMLASDGSSSIILWLCMCMLPMEVFNESLIYDKFSSILKMGHQFSVNNVDLVCMFCIH